MKAEKITEGIYCLPVNLEIYRLFEGMWPMPNGISINSYVVQGEKTALIDMVENVNGKPEEFEAKLHSISLEVRNIDYLIINHMEPDHTGWLSAFHAKNPGVQIYLTGKATALLNSFYGIDQTFTWFQTATPWIWAKGKY